MHQRGRLIRNMIARDGANRNLPAGANVAHPAQAHTVAQPMTGQSIESASHSRSYRRSKSVTGWMSQRPTVSPNNRAAGATAPRRALRIVPNKPRERFTVERKAITTYLCNITGQ